MARRESRANKGYNREMEGIATLQRKLSISEKENKMLKADVQEANREIEQREDDIDSLNRHLSALERSFDFTNVAWRKKLNKAKEEIRQKEKAISSLRRHLSALEELTEERVEAQEEFKKRDEEIISLKQSLHAQKEETERMRASAGQLKEASEVENMEETWQTKISQLEELLATKTKKHRVRNNAHVDTLIELNAACSALKGSRLRCDALEENLLKQLADTKENHRKELTEQAESHQKELSEELEQAKNELIMLCESWERSNQQHEQEKREMEEMLLVKEKTGQDKKEDIQHLMEENNRLQELIKKQRIPDLHELVSQFAAL